MNGIISDTAARRQIIAVTGFGISIFLAACSNSSNPLVTPPPPPPPPAGITVSGVVTDGPVTGGSLFLFAPEQVLLALNSVDPAGDRAAALGSATNIGMLTRDPTSADQYSLEVAGDNSGRPVFIVFDNVDAEDGTFMDTPANLESVLVLGAAGSSQRANVSLQSTLIARQVRAVLDPEGDGTVIDDAAIVTAIDTAKANVLSAFATDALGRDLYPPGFDPLSHDVDDDVHSASSALGLLLRAAGIATDTGFDLVLEALTADLADGAFDGSIPVNLAPTPEQTALAEEVNDVGTAGNDDEIFMFAVGPCSSAAVSLQQACSVDIVDDLFEGTAICTDILDDDDRSACLDDLAIDVADKGDECDDVFSARLSLCESISDAAHEPTFGPAFVDNFIDPLEIGVSEPVNPWFPLVTGNRWVYAGGDESIVVEVTAETKLIDGVTCVVVIDTASADGVVVEITRDWHAQDTDGNVWYCGEISRNFELFTGDLPETPELVDIEGSWKSGRDGAQAGILLPFAPQVGDVIRQEVSYGEAEDVIRIDAVDATETAPAGSCTGTCLMTTDFTPLEPGVEENKFYVSGLGLIVEVDVESGDRVELVEFTSAP